MLYFKGKGEQYYQAVEYAKAWKAKEGNNVILTGHSLGGGLASAAGIRTGLRTTAINSAPLPKQLLWKDPGKSIKITQYCQENEILTTVDKGDASSHERPGNKIEVKGTYPSYKPKKMTVKEFWEAIENHLKTNTAPAVHVPKKVYSPPPPPPPVEQDFQWPL